MGFGRVGDSMSLKTANDIPDRRVTGVECTNCDSEFIVKEAYAIQFLSKCPSCGSKMRRVPCNNDIIQEE